MQHVATLCNMLLRGGRFCDARQDAKAMHQIRLRVCNVLKFWTQAAHRAALRCKMLRCGPVQRTNAAQRNAAKRSAAQHSTAQHSTAQLLRWCRITRPISSPVGISTRSCAPCFPDRLQRSQAQAPPARRPGPRIGRRRGRAFLASANAEAGRGFASIGFGFA